MQDIETERELLGELREKSHVIDTSHLRSSQLQSYIKELIAAPVGQMTLVFQSFGFKHGLPSDSDYVFDVRMLPNPHYEPQLRPLTGMDAPVAEFLRQQPGVDQMRRDIQQFLESWLDMMASNHRSYVTVAIGCTGTAPLGLPGRGTGAALRPALAHPVPAPLAGQPPHPKPADLLAHDI